jgi:large subunit ribosomal protein L7/L12
MAEYSATIAALGDQIAGLKLSEAAALMEYLKEAYRIAPAVGGTVVVPPIVKPTPDPDPGEKAVTVVLDGVADATKRIAVIRVVREVVNCPLTEGRAIVEGAPRAIKEAVTREEAEVIRKKLEEAGARVSLK